MAQLLRAQRPGFISKPTWQLMTPRNSRPRGSNILFWHPWALHTWCTIIHADKTPTHNKIKKGKEMKRPAQIEFGKLSLELKFHQLWGSAVYKEPCLSSHGLGPHGPPDLGSANIGPCMKPTPPRSSQLAMWILPAATQHSWGAQHLWGTEALIQVPVLSISSPSSILRN